MGLIIKRSMKAFWNTKDWPQKPISFVSEQFLLETGFTSLMKKVPELVQHFREQCKHYVSKQYITYKHWWKFAEVNYEEEKRKGKKKNCSSNKSETNFYKIWYGLMVCRAMLGKMPYMQKRHMDEFINVSHVFIND